MTKQNIGFGENPSTRLENKFRKYNIINIFKEWLGDDFNDWAFSLYRFAIIRPFVYFESGAINELLSLFQQDPNLTLSIFDQNKEGITHAILSMIRKGNNWDNEDKLTLDDAYDMAQFDSIWHPEYLRYSEHIYNHLINVPLGILGNINNRDYNSPTLKNRVSILDEKGFAVLTTGYNPIIRNSLAHGSISYDLYVIKYYGSNGTIEELMPSEFGKLFDNLVNTCHSIIISILIFLIRNKATIENKGLRHVPLGLKYLLIDGITSNSHLSVETMFESNVMAGKQLNIYCKTRAQSRIQHIYEGINIFQNSINIGCDDYERFALSFDCGQKIPVSLFLNVKAILGSKVGEIRLSGLKESVENSLLWYDSPRWKRIIMLLKQNLSVSIKLFKIQIINEWKNRGLKITFSKYAIKRIENKSTNKIARLEAYIYLMPNIELNPNMLIEILNHAVKKLKKKRQRRIAFTKEKGFPKVPKYIWIKFFDKNQRFRTMYSGGWANIHYIFNAEWIRRKDKDKPVLINAPDKVINSISIKINPEILSKLNKNGNNLS